MTTKIPIELSSTPGIVDSSNTTALTLDASQNATFAGTVTGSRKLVLNASGTNDTHIEIGANTASNHYAFIDLVGDATYTDYGLRIIRNNGGANTSSFIYHRGTGNFNIETQDSASLKLRTAGADALTIDTSQRVGIGTTSPNQLLHLDNSASSSDSASIRIISGTAGLARIMLGDTGYGSRGRFVYDNSDDSLQLWGANSTTSAERMRISSSGSVGIGTSPATHYTGYEALDIGNVLSLFSNNSGTNVSTLTNNGYLNSSASQWTYKVTDEATMYSQVHGDHRFSTAASGSAGSAISWVERMRINNSGQVGIGTTSPSFDLDIQDTSNTYLNIQATATNGEALLALKGKNSSGTDRTLQLKYDNSDLFRIATPSAVDIRFETSDTERMRISSSGQVRIGTTSFSNGRLDVRSDVANTTEVIGVKNDNSGSYNVMMKFFRQSSAVGRIDWDNTGSSMGFVNLSDERLKTVTGIAKGLSFINRLEPKTYNFKDNDWETEGLIAQEVKAAMEAEEIVVRGIREPETEDDYYGLDYGTFVPNLIQAIKELSAKNDALEARIKELEG